MKHTSWTWQETTEPDGTIHRALLGDGDVILYEKPVPTMLACDSDPKQRNRIVACVNACEGINPKAVPDLLEALEEMVATWGKEILLPRSVYIAIALAVATGEALAKKGSHA